MSQCEEEAGEHAEGFVYVPMNHSCLCSRGVCVCHRFVIFWLLFRHSLSLPHLKTDPATTSLNLEFLTVCVFFISTSSTSHICVCVCCFMCASVVSSVGGRERFGATLCVSGLGWRSLGCGVCFWEV